jgi:hypothetical protein
VTYLPLLLLGMGAYHIPCLRPGLCIGIGIGIGIGTCTASTLREGLNNETQIAASLNQSVPSIFDTEATTLCCAIYTTMADSVGDSES